MKKQTLIASASTLLLTLTMGSTFGGAEPPSGSFAGPEPPSKTYAGSEPPAKTFAGPEPPSKTYAGSEPPAKTFAGSEPPSNAFAGSEPPGVISQRFYRVRKAAFSYWIENHQLPKGLNPAELGAKDLNEIRDMVIEAEKISQARLKFLGAYVRDFNMERINLDQVDHASLGLANKAAVAQFVRGYLGLITGAKDNCGVAGEGNDLLLLTKTERNAFAIKDIQR